MRYLFCKSNLSGLILAALAAGTWSLPAVAAQQSQSSTTQSRTTTTQKKSSGTAAAKSRASSSKTSSKTTSSKSSSRKKSKKVKGQAAPTPGRISEIQEALASKGAFAGTPSGKWDDSTVDAMKKFQSSHGLDPTGKLDALTLQKLGLGSQTAGLAAPKAPPNSINRLRNTSSAAPEEQPEDQPRN
jgi:peptidoglycan hydrolase-like protein with peptidoglycan-binding domain